MKIDKKKRLLSYILAILMVFTYVPTIAYATDGESTDGNAGISLASSEATVLDGKVRIVDDFGTAIATNNIVAITAVGVLTGKATRNNITVYNDSKDSIILVFDYSASNWSEFSEGRDEGSFRAVIDSGQSVHMYITGIRKTSGDNTAKLTLSNFAYTVVPDSSNVTVKYDESLGSIDLDGEAIGSDAANGVSYTEGGTFVAEPKEGVKFAGWIDPETGKIYSRELSYTVKPTEDMAVEAVFMGEETETYYLVGNEYLETDFNKAMSKTADTADKTVVLLKDTTLPAGEYTVPSGVTFLVPFDDENTLYTTEPKGIKAAKQEPDAPTAYCTLTLAEGADMVINGAVSLSAKHNAANGGGRASGMPIGDISYLVTGKDSTVTVNSGGALYAYGYIIGEGNVVAKNGSTVYENFMIEDFKGGEVTLDIAYDNMDKGILPISQYYVQNIEVPITLEAGAKEFVYTSMFTNNNVYGSGVLFMGDSTAMFHLEEGSVVKSYDATTDRLIFDVDGKMNLSSIEVSMAGASIDSEMFDLPINSNITVNLNDGEVEISQDIALLPGAQINIEEGTTCTLAEGINLFVYDRDQWNGYVGLENKNFIPLKYSPTRANEETRTEADLKDAAIKVNGTFDASLGFIFTTTSEDASGGGANIYSSASGMIKTATGVAPEAYQYKHNNEGGVYELINLLPMNLKNKDGSYVQTLETGIGTYTYKDGQWICSHEAYKEEVTKEPTCTEEGIKTITCNIEEIEAGYGHKHTESIPMLPHTEVIDEAVEATCTETGLTEGKHCSVCGTVLVEREVAEALGHKWEETKVFDKEPTCTEDGIMSTHCERCDIIKEGSEEPVKTKGHTYEWIEEAPTCTEEGEKYGKCIKCGVTTEKEKLDPVGHKYKNYVTEPTCTEKGYTTHTCSRCDDSYVDTYTPAAGHNEVAAEKKEATCTETGYTAGSYCDKCGEVFEGKEEIKALGHKYGEWITDEEATCTERGSKHRDCGRCDDVDKAIIYPAGHTPVLDEEVEATCTETGLTAGSRCDVCGYELVEQEIIPALGHKEVIDKAVEATCTETGLTEGKHCRVCEEVLMAQETVEAKGHTEVIDEAVEATCTEAGLTEGKHCGVCEEVLIAQEKVKAKGHALEYFNGKEATCTDKGYEPYEECTVCDYTTYKEIAAKGHTYKEHQEAPTCTEDGYIVKHCGCGDEIIIEGEKATGHSFTKYTESVHPTCEEIGKEKAKCDNGCGAVDVRDIPATGHPNAEAKAKQDPTCTEAGYEAGTWCPDCETWIEGHEEIPAIAHKNAEAKAEVPATCEKIGYTAGTWCPDCEEWIEGHEEIPAIAHKNSEAKEKVPATCEDIGYEAGKWCPDCEAWIEGHEEIPAIAHKNAEAKAEVPATCESIGYEAGKWCPDCEEWIEGHEVIAAIAHKNAEAKAEVPATCEDIGYTAGKWCPDCETWIEGHEEIAAIAHKDAEAKAEVPATCEKIGYTEGTWCPDCEEWIEGHEVIAAITHKNAEAKAEVPATCEKIGYEAGKWCPDCEEWIEGHEVIAAIEHKNAESKPGQLATCTEGGYASGTWCPDCEEWIEGHEAIDPLDHDIIKHEAKMPTKSADGHYAYEECGRCDYTTYKVYTYREYVKSGVEETKLTVTAEGVIKTEQITVEWTNSSSFDITYYNVFRSTTGEVGTFDYIGKSTMKSYTDKKAEVGMTYYYKVIGYHQYDADTVYKTLTSEAASAEIKKVTSSEVKATPMYATTNYENKGLKIMWTSPNIKVDGYEVWRSTTKNGTYTKKKTTDSNVYSWKNTGLKVGKRYFYKVRAYKLVDGKKVYTKFSSKGYRYVLSGNDAKLAKAIVRSDAVTAKKATKVSSGIKVTWTKKTSIKCNRYEVWRATSKSGTYTKIATTKNKYYTDKKAKKGKTYYYKIKGYRVFGKSTAKTNYSNVVSGKR